MSVDMNYILFYRSSHFDLPPPVPPPLSSPLPPPSPSLFARWGLFCSLIVRCVWSSLHFIGDEVLVTLDVCTSSRLTNCLFTQSPSFFSSKLFFLTSPFFVYPSSHFSISIFFWRNTIACVHPSMLKVTSFGVGHFWAEAVNDTYLNMRPKIIKENYILALQVISWYPLIVDKLLRWSLKYRALSSQRFRIILNFLLFSFLKS